MYKNEKVAVRKIRFAYQLFLAEAEKKAHRRTKRKVTIFILREKWTKEEKKKTIRASECEIPDGKICRQMAYILLAPTTITTAAPLHGAMCIV